MKNKINMISLARKLFPINRSILGDGFKKSLKYIKNIHPDMKIKSIKSGTKVFDWVIPKEWNIKEAYILHSSGKKFADFKKNNLHVVGYSCPIDKKLDLREVQKKIYTIPNKPKWIPYKTSYYKNDWGFCMSHSEKKRMPRGMYRVKINSSLKDGELQYGEILIKGKTKKEIFFSTYLCHPSMANNELSGPVLSTFLIDYVKKNYKSLKYSYRFIFIPETIGSIAYLSRNLKKLRRNMISGYVLSCVGDERAFSHVESKSGKTLSDISIKAALIGKKNVKHYSFLERGSDERQYCAPNINLPVSGFCRSKYHVYPEYHTSADNFDVVTKDGLNGSFEVIKSVIDGFETCLIPKHNFLGEPQMSKYNLYYNISAGGDADKQIKLRMDLLAYMDGEKNIFEITRILNKPLDLIIKELKILLNSKLIKSIK